MSYVPLISSGIAGPLGALHLPRLWLKLSLEAVGKLDVCYPGLGNGFDQMTCNQLGFDGEAAKQFVASKKPTYPEFEDWVKQNGTKLSKADIHRHNLAILGYCHDGATRKDILAASGLPDDGSVLPGAIDLNNLDDWQTFHARVLAP